ncbi:hypothetical protein SPOG_02735 [Schizosaccharomyces cryophilus OY26]|uniref:Uncharacterized protein n=1 Tax=Schizosaccharomyces cryophilus (strain OY26 / ATCC MYA-4695 / CBS 11777 / NBRC 106824 / NRRL Y48691) TaxID=653667 RepID=S9W0I2_SCHCR|nr:uncharacterized protein SPOG_02735 [Schizosaccharomyces cryophilus OY26]EPY51565.1 hypothetical protein SPOG_02735 [Schizosaccharomyces cryophilus OY26]
MTSTIKVIKDKQCQSLIEKKTEEYESTRVKDITQLITSDEAISLMSIETTDVQTVLKIENLIKNVLQFIQEKNQAMFNVECKLICSKYAFQVSDSKNKALKQENESLKDMEHCLRVQIFQQEQSIKPITDKQKELEMDVFQLTKEKKMHQLKIRQQDKEKSVLSSQCDRLKRHLNSVTEDNYRHQHNANILKDDLEAKEEENRHLYKERKALIASVDRANFEAEQLQYQLEKHSEEDVLTKSSIENLSKTINIIRNDCQKVEEENRILNVEKGLLAQKIMALENDLEELEITCQNYKEEIEDFAAENTDLKKKLKSRKQLEPIPEEAHTVIESEENEESERQRKLLKKIEEENEKIREYELPEQHINLETKYEEIASALDKSQRECATLKDEKEAIIGENLKLKGLMKELETGIEQAKKESEKLNSEINAVTQENDSMKEKCAKFDALQEKLKESVKRFKDLTFEHARQTVKAESLTDKCQKYEHELNEKERQWNTSSSLRLQEIKALNIKFHDQTVQLETLQNSNVDLLKKLQERQDTVTLKNTEKTLSVRQKHVSLLERENQKLQKLREVQMQKYNYYLDSIQSLSNEKLHFYENEILILQNQIHMFTLDAQNKEIQRGLTSSRSNKGQFDDQNKLTNNQTIVYMSSFELRTSRDKLRSEEDKENSPQITNKAERSLIPENVQWAGVQSMETLDETNILQYINKTTIENASQKDDKTSMIHLNEIPKELVDDEYVLFINEKEPTVNINEEESARKLSLFYSEEEKSQLPGFIVDAKPASCILFPCCQDVSGKRSNKKKEASKKKLAHQIFRSQ